MYKIKVNRRNSKKNLSEVIGKCPEKELFFFDESRLAHIQRLDMGGLKRGLEHRLKQN